MNNQINASDQNIQQIKDNPINQPMKISEKLKVNYLIIGTFVLIGFTVFGIGGYFLGKTSNSQSQLTRQTEPTTIPSTTPVSTSWTTYQNTAYNFEFQYPTTFVYQETSGEGQDHNNNISLANFKTIDEKGLAVLLDNTAFSVNYLKKYAPTGGENFNPELQTIGNNTFYYYGSGGGGVCYPDQYFFNLNGKILIFNFTGCDNDKTPSKETKVIERQMLSTFKVSIKILPSPTTSQAITIKYSARTDWQTYADDVAKFSLQYNTSPTQPYNSHQSLGKNEVGKSVMIMGCHTPPNNQEVCSEQYTVTIYSNYNGGSRRDWMSKNINDYSCQRYYSDVSVAGKNAMLATSDCSSWGETYVLIPNGSQMIVFLTQGYSRNNTTGKITLQAWINEVLSTFKFN